MSSLYLPRRLGRYNDSLLSFTSTCSDSLSSSSSISTKWGIGTVSGRAVLGLGSLALQGFESRAIRKRLRVIKAMMPIQDDSPPPDVDEALDDLLELSRLNLYSGKTKSRSLALLFQQLGSTQHRHLADRVSRLPADEMSVFLTLVMLTMLSLKGRGIYERFRTAIYKKSIPTHYLGDEAMPLLDFVVQVAKNNELAFETVIRSGLLDMILLLTHRNREVMCVREGPWWAACESALTMLMCPPPGLVSMWQTQLGRFLCSSTLPCLSQLHEIINSQTPDLWIEIEARFWEKEVLAWQNMTVTVSVFEETFANRTRGECNGEDLVNASSLKTLSSFLRRLRQVGWVSPWIVKDLFHRPYQDLVSLFTNILLLSIPEAHHLFVEADPQVLLVAKHVQLDTALGLLDDIYETRHQEHITSDVLEATLLKVIPYVRPIVPSWHLMEDVLHEFILLAAVDLASYGDPRSRFSLNLGPTLWFERGLDTTATNPILAGYRSAPLFHISAWFKLPKPKTES
ncbi:hypothetical protein C8J56DRAFT_1042212 [Mycena floridula]|nr:hypothetical protein C8J56DRAFT_1042212 [Mycena floridula]